MLQPGYIRVQMTRCVIALVCCVIASSLVCLGDEVEDPDPEAAEELLGEPQLPANPYQAIPDRNVFGLKPIPPPPQQELPKPPPPNIILSGITKLNGRTTAYLKTPPVAAKPGQPAKGDQYFMLAEGEMDRDMKVIQIDEATGVVKVAYSGTEIALNFTDNGAKPMAVPAAPVPGQGGAIPTPGVRPGGLPAATPRPISLPTRTPRTPSRGIPPPGGAAQGNSIQGQGASTTLNPSDRATRTAQTYGQQNIPEAQQLTAEQEAVLQELERQHTADLANRQAPPPLPSAPAAQRGRMPLPQ